MREILFRGKSLKTGKWTQGYLFRCWEHAYIAWGMVNDNADMKEVEPKTVCQYTGLTDKNGRKIFEGDIISFDYELSNWGRIAKVLFEDGEYRYRAIANAADLYNCRICGENDRCEIIGNIFDNPELIGDQP